MLTLTEWEIKLDDEATGVSHVTFLYGGWNNQTL